MHTRAFVSMFVLLPLDGGPTQDDIQALHTKVKGNTDKLFAFFRDLLPEEGHANFTKVSRLLLDMNTMPRRDAVAWWSIKCGAIVQGQGLRSS